MNAPTPPVAALPGEPTDAELARAAQIAYLTASREGGDQWVAVARMMRAWFAPSARREDTVAAAEARAYEAAAKELEGRACMWCSAGVCLPDQAHRSKAFEDAAGIVRAMASRAASAAGSELRDVR